jgi:hypothetical protein
MLFFKFPAPFVAFKYLLQLALILYIFWVFKMKSLSTIGSVNERHLLDDYDNVKC